MGTLFFMWHLITFDYLSYYNFLEPSLQALEAVFLSAEGLF